MISSIRDWPFVRLRKFGMPADPRIVSPPPSQYAYGCVNSTATLPIGYWLEGWLIAPPALGKPVRIVRANRNGTRCLGLFESTPVVSLLLGWSFSTENSLYECAPVSEPSVPALELLSVFDPQRQTDAQLAD